MLGKKFSLVLGIGLLGASMLSLNSCGKDKEPDGGGGEGCKNTSTEPIFDEIPNLDFEEWVSGSGVGTKYQNPAPANFWATPNNGSGKIGTIAEVPVTVFKVGGDSVYSGNAAVMLKTGSGMLSGKETVVAATVASGVFAIDITNPLKSLSFGKRFNKRPKTVSGYYRYFPVSGDSASVYCFVTKLDKNCKPDTIGFGRKLFYDQQASYAKFEFDLEYKNTDTPDNIVIYFSSSEAGDDFKGQPGNTLFIDAVNVEYH